MVKNCVFLVHVYVVLLLDLPEDCKYSFVFFPRFTRFCVNYHKLRSVCNSVAGWRDKRMTRAGRLI